MAFFGQHETNVHQTPEDVKNDLIRKPKLPLEDELQHPDLARDIVPDAEAHKEYVKEVEILPVKTQPTTATTTKTTPKPPPTTKKAEEPNESPKTFAGKPPRIAGIITWAGDSIIPKERIPQVAMLWRMNHDIADLHFFVDPPAAKALEEFIFNDDAKSTIAAENVFIRTDFEGETLSKYVARKAKEVLKLPIASVDGRHLCDYRPLFGEIFAPMLVNYSNWAWVDEETHVASLHRFVTPDDLNKFNIISMLGHSYIPKTANDPWYQLYTRGPLTILKNDHKTNTAWRWVDQEKINKTFLGDQNNNFDEYIYTHGVALKKSDLAVMFVHQGFDFKEHHNARIDITADGESSIYASANCKNCDQEKLFEDMCAKQDDEVKLLDAHMMENSGYWGAKHIDAKNTGFLRYWRDSDGRWFSKKISEHVCGRNQLHGLEVDLHTAEHTAEMNITYSSTFRNRNPDLGQLTILYCATTEGADDNPSHDIRKQWNMAWWRAHFDSVLLPWDEAPDPLPARTVILIPQTIGELTGCQKHPLYIMARKAQREAKTLEALGVAVDRGWHKDVHYPHPGRLKSLKGRPLVFGSLGEVFWAPFYGPNDDFDLMMYRSRERPRPGCLTAHFLQCVTHGYRQEYITNTKETHRINIFNVLKTSPDRPIPPKFCQLQTMAVLHRARYYTDALVRWATLRLLNEYKRCEYIGYLQSRRAKQMGTVGEQCLSQSWNQTTCMMPFKFSIVMDNTQEDGYISEKLFNAKLAGSVPIYFGAPDVLDYLNPKAFVWCNVSRESVQRMRTFYPQPRGTTKINRRFTFEGAGDDPKVVGFDSPHGGDGQLIDWAAEFYRKELKQCIDEVKRLDNDDKAFTYMRNQPLVLKREILTGRNMAESIDKVFKMSGV